MVEVKDPRYQERVKHIFGSAPFVRHIGAKLDGCGPGWCESSIELAPQHMQQDDVVHAGVQSTLADHTAGAAAGTLLGSDEIVLTASFHVHFLRGARGQRLRCRAQVVKPGRQLVVSEAIVHAEDDGRSVETARLTATLAVVKLG